MAESTHCLNDGLAGTPCTVTGEAASGSTCSALKFDKPQDDVGQVNDSSGKGAPRVLRHLGAQLPLLIRGVYYEGWRL